MPDFNFESISGPLTWYHALIPFLGFFVAWLSAYIFADPDNKLLDALGIREKLQEKLNAVPGSETFMDYMFDCKTCTGTWPSLAAIFAGNYALGDFPDAISLITLVATEFGAVTFLHHIFNQYSSFSKSGRVVPPMPPIANQIKEIGDE